MQTRQPLWRCQELRRDGHLYVSQGSRLQQFSSCSNVIEPASEEYALLFLRTIELHVCVFSAAIEPGSDGICMSRLGYDTSLAKHIVSDLFNKFSFVFCHVFIFRAADDTFLRDQQHFSSYRHFSFFPSSARAALKRTSENDKDCVAGNGNKVNFSNY